MLDIQIKVVLLGHSCAGKTSLVQRLISNKYTDKYNEVSSSLSRKFFLWTKSAPLWLQKKTVNQFSFQNFPVFRKTKKNANFFAPIEGLFPATEGMSRRYFLRHWR